MKESVVENKNCSKLQIVVARKDGKQASGKAPSDVSSIADDYGFVRLNLNTKGKNKLVKLLFHCIEVNKLYKKIDNDSVVLIQNPIWYRALNISSVLKKLKKYKNVKYICLIHDVEELRNSSCAKWLKKEFQVMLDVADTLIVHNEKMKKYFVDLGVNEDRLIVLDIFDYLHECSIESDAEFEKSITIAGNLSIDKATYIKELGELENINVYLYGTNYSDVLKKHSNVFYHGAFPAEELPAKLNKGFGLVWDGTSISKCSGNMGEYLKYNNPHKLSLYLASGIPVIIWSSAAEADFVRKNNVGICVDSLYNLESVFSKMTKEDYDNMVDSVKKVQTKLLNGYFTMNAFGKALNKIKEYR